MLRLKAFILSATLILVGSLITYFQSYKDLGAILNFLIFLLVLIGWILLYSILFSKYSNEESPKRTKKGKANFKKGKFLSTVFGIIFGAIAVANIILVNNLAENRVTKILKFDTTNTTIATVTQFSERNYRGGSKHYVLIEYNTVSKHVTQAIYDYRRIYSIGQKIKIKYSVEYPEMFEVVQI